MSIGHWMSMVALDSMTVGSRATKRNSYCGRSEVPVPTVANGSPIQVMVTGVGGS